MDILQPPTEESSGVVYEIRRTRKGIDIPSPAESLIALRAVSRDREEVATHRPDDVLVEFVKERVRAVEEPRPLQVRVDHDGRDRVGV